MVAAVVGGLGPGKSTCGECSGKLIVWALRQRCFVEETCRYPSGDNRFLIEQPSVETSGGHNPVDNKMIERPAHLSQSLVTGGTVHDQLGDHRVVVGGDFTSALDG